MGIKIKATFQAVVPLNVDDANSVKAEVDFFEAHLYSWVELEQSKDSQGTHCYLHILHSLLFTTVNCSSLFIIYKTAGDFERFSAQAPVLEWHKGAEEEEEDAESSASAPKSLSWCPRDVQWVHPCPSHMETCTGEATSHPEQASDSITSPETMKKGSSSVWICLVGGGIIRDCILPCLTHKLQPTWTAGKRFPQPSVTSSYAPPTKTDVWKIIKQEPWNCNQKSEWMLGQE